MNTVNLGNRTGNVAPGDTVICRGEYVAVQKVWTMPPGHRLTIVRSDMTAVIVKTHMGCRYLGADRAWIGSDLRMYWERGDSR